MYISCSHVGNPVLLRHCVAWLRCTPGNEATTKAGPKVDNDQSAWLFFSDGASDVTMTMKGSKLG